MFAGNRARRALLSAVVCLSAPVWLHARVIKITIVSRAPAFNGQAMGPFGAYEKIKGIATGELDPKDRRNAVITDIELAPRNPGGRVEYRANFTLVKPVDSAKAPGVLLYNVVNRGGHGGP